MLVVEDHGDSCDMLMRLLQRVGYEVGCATTAAEALAALKQLPVRLVIADYNLPDHDGLWLLRQINEDASLAAMRTIFFSGTYEADTSRRALPRARPTGS